MNGRFRHFRGLVVLLAVSLAILPLTGCVNTVRLAEREIIQAIGFDLQKGGEYVLTFQLFTPTLGDPSGGKLEIAQGQGDSFARIFSDLAIERGRQLYPGNLLLAVIGERAAEEGSGAFLEYLSANHQIPPTLPIVVVQGSAGELLKAGEKAPALSAQKLIEMLVNAQKSGQAVSATLLEVLAAMKSENESAIVPLIALQGQEKSERPAQEGTGEPPDSLMQEIVSDTQSSSSDESQSGQNSGNASDEEEQPPQAVLTGAGLFWGERLRLQLDLPLAKGLCWLGNELVAAVITVEDPSFGKTSVVIHSSTMQVVPEVIADSIVFQMRLSVRGSIVESDWDTSLQNGGNSEGDREGTLPMQPSGDMEYLAFLLEKEIGNELERSLSASCRQGYDPMGFSALAKQRCSAFYRMHVDDWQQVMRDAGYSLQVNCEIDRTGAEQRS